MVNVSSAKTALLVGGGLFALLFIGTIWRFVSRMVSFAVLALFVIVGIYIAYELHSGWQKADTSDNIDDSGEPIGRFDKTTDTGSNVDGRSDTVTEDELDRELDRLREQTSNAEPEKEFETD